MNRLALTLTVVLATTGPATADVINIINPSFESPHLVLGDPGVVSFLPEGITRYDAAGWTVYGAGGTFQPVVGLAVNYVPDGSQVGWANDLAAHDSYLYQDTGTPSVAGTQYVLSVAVGSRLDPNPPNGGFPSSYLVELLEGNTVIGSASGQTSAGTGNFSAVSVTGVGTGSGTLGIRLEDTGYYSQTLFDDVHLESMSTAVPEPATLTLACLGAAGLIGYGRRLRRIITA
jgi:hypothetical protein